MICCFLKFIFWVGAYHVIALIYWPRVIFPSAFMFAQTEWFLPPHWSRAVVYESLNDATEDTIWLSLWDRVKLSVVCKTESIPAFAANVCERNYKENKGKNQMVNYTCTFCLLLWFCLYNCLGASLSRNSGREQRRGMKGEEFFHCFIFILLSFSLSIFRRKPRSETLTTQA